MPAKISIDMKIVVKKLFFYYQKPKPNIKPDEKLNH